MKFDWRFFWDSLISPNGAFVDGLWLTIGISVISMVLGLIFGLFIALMHRSRYVALRIFAKFYIWLIRGTPLLVQLVIVYLGLAAAGVYKFEDADLFGGVVKGAIQAAIV